MRTQEQLLAETYVMLTELKNYHLFKLKWIISESLKDLVENDTQTIWGREFVFSKLIEKDCVVLSSEEYVDYAMEWERMYLIENNL